jgi:hypothetical protein
MDSSELVKMCYEWQMNNLKVDGWAKKLKELEKMGLAYIWQNQAEINVTTVKQLEKDATIYKGRICLQI